MKDRLRIGAAFLSVIVLSTPFFGIGLWSTFMQAPRVHTESSVLTFEVLNTTIHSDKTETP